MDKIQGLVKRIRPKRRHTSAFVSENGEESEGRRVGGSLRLSMVEWTPYVVQGCELSNPTTANVRWISAVRAGDFVAAIRALDSGADVDYKGDDGRAAIHIACDRADMTMLDTFICHRGNMHLKGPNGSTGLHIACQNQHEQIVHSLLTSATPSSVVDNDYRTPLHIVACLGNVAIVEMLLKCHDVKINARDFDGATALILAAGLGYVEVVKRLIAAGCDLDERNAEHATALIEATSMGHIEIVRVLLEAGCHVNVMDSHGWAALSYTAFLGYEPLAMTLLQGGADINAQDMHGRTALHEAIYSGYHDLARLLIDAGCKLDVQDQDGYTPMFLASWDPKNCSMLPVVDWLCRHGANLDIADSQGMVAVEKAWPKKQNLLCLIQHGCCLHVRRQGYCLLELATMENNLMLAAFLLAAGCDPAQVNFSGIDSRFTASFQTLKQLCMVPLSLREQCRIKIRRQLGTPFLHQKISYLPLPQLIIKYLCFSDVTVKDFWPDYQDRRTVATIRLSLMFT